MFTKLFDDLGKDFDLEKKLFQEKKLSEVIKSLENKESTNATTLRGITFMLLKKFKKAIIEFENIKNEDKLPIRKDSVYEFLGVLYFEIKNNLEATKYFVLSLENNPNNFYSKYNLANIYMLNKNYKKAYDMFKELQEVEPDNLVITKNIKFLEKKL